MRPVEIRMSNALPAGTVVVRTGVYVFENTTLKDVYELVRKADPKPDFIEMDIAQFEEEDD